MPMVRDAKIKKIKKHQHRCNSRAEREYEVRELIPHIGLIPKVISLKLFLDMVPSSPADDNARCVGALACF